MKAAETIKWKDRMGYGKRILPRPKKGASAPAGRPIHTEEP